MRANLMKFYGGAIGYWDVEELPIPRLNELVKQADKINREIKREAEKSNVI